jgi:hypothetical protein
MTKDDVLLPPAAFRGGSEDERLGSMPHVRGAPLHLLPRKRQVDRHGLEMLRPRERRRPQMPNALPKMIEARICRSRCSPRARAQACRFGADRGGVGGIIVSGNGVWKVPCRHGLNTRSKHLGLIAGYAAPYETPSEPRPEQHIEVSEPGELVGIDCFYVGRPERHRGCDLAAHRDRHRLLLRLCGARGL